MPTLEQIKDLTKLLPEERDEIQRLFITWREAQERKDWAVADKLRAQFWWWDEMLGGDGLWLPILSTA